MAVGGEVTERDSSASDRRGIGGTRRSAARCACCGRKVELRPTDLESLLPEITERRRQMQMRANAEVRRSGFLGPVRPFGQIPRGGAIAGHQLGARRREVGVQEVCRPRAASMSPARAAWLPSRTGFARRHWSSSIGPKSRSVRRLTEKFARHALQSPRASISSWAGTRGVNWRYSSMDAMKRRVYSEVVSSTDVADRIAMELRKIQTIANAIQF